MHQETQPGPAVAVLLLDELVVARSAAEAGGQHPLEHVDDVGVEEVHTARRELLEAPDGAQVGRPAEAVQGAAASSLADDAPVPEGGVHEDELRRGSERRDEEGVRR
jgi:hypothetical protein